MQSFPPSFTVLKLSQVENRKAVAMVTNMNFLNFESIFFLIFESSKQSCSALARELRWCRPSSSGAADQLNIERMCQSRPEIETPREIDIQRYWVVERTRHRDWSIERLKNWEVETLRERDIEIFLEILSQRENAKRSDRNGNLETSNVGASFFFHWLQKTLIFVN